MTTYKKGDRFFECTECESSEAYVTSSMDDMGKGEWECNDCGYKGEFWQGKAISVEEMLMQGKTFMDKGKPY